MFITGEEGFIGSALKRELTNMGIDGDYFFFFGSPSSQILFNENTGCIRETIESFLDVCDYCKRHRLKLIFPSSATVYDNNNSYSRTKSALEDIVEAYGIDYLALRIFAGYGPGEGHKKDYASIIYQWCRDMKKNISPVVYGDGQQSRDFVYINDIVYGIIDNIDKKGVIDIGTGLSTNFNEVIRVINKVLHKDIKPTYISRPVKYIDETICMNPLKAFTPLEQGIKYICESLT